MSNTAKAVAICDELAATLIKHAAAGDYSPEAIDALVAATNDAARRVKELTLAE